MIVSFHPVLWADFNTILGGREGLSHGELELLHKAEAVLLPHVCPEFLYRVVKSLNKPAFPDQGIRLAYPGKVGQAILFKKARIPHPKTQIWERLWDLLSQARDPQWRFPFLIKLNQAHEGDGIYFIGDYQGLEQRAEEIGKRTKEERLFITQEFVNTRGKVLRVVIVYDQIVSFWKVSTDGNPVVAISKGAEIIREFRPTLTEKGKKIALELAKEFNIHIGAFDIAFDMDETEPEPMLLEINFFFGRRGLGGSRRYYSLLLKGARAWAKDLGLSPDRIRLAV